MIIKLSAWPSLVRVLLSGVLATTRVHFHSIKCGQNYTDSTEYKLHDDLVLSPSNMKGPELEGKIIIDQVRSRVDEQKKTRVVVEVFHLLSLCFHVVSLAKALCKHNHSLCHTVH